MPPPRLSLGLSSSTGTCCLRLLRPAVPPPRCLPFLRRANCAPSPLFSPLKVAVRLQPPRPLRQFSTTAPRYEAELPSTKEGKRSSLAKSLSDRLDHMQAAIFMAGQKINDLTGYSGIEALKRDIDAQEANLSASKALVKEAKAEYKAAIARRSDSQKEVNELLQRKNTWNPTDLERFTELYRSDHANEQAEIQAQNRLAEVEKEVDSISSELSKSILTRYHEEQVWSDKIRRASTWGTWMLMGFNIVLFIVVQLGLEPWKRRRLEEKDMIIMAQGVANPEAVVAVTSESTEDSANTSEIGEEEVITAEILETDVATTVEGEAATVDGEAVDEGEETEGEYSDPEEEGMNVLELIMHRLGKYFREDSITVSQADISLWVIEGFVVGMLTSVTLTATLVLLTDGM
ncbi:hypothetical protein ABW21_db0204020 [Orbilia brochopaga]|nr:hypothetical protein ABW21_db0204020 [Drechslerella brochopaga]